MTDVIIPPGEIPPVQRPTGNPGQLRAPSSRVIEKTRGLTSEVIEALLGPYDRLHPLPKGCTYQGRQGVAGLGVAGCMTAGLDNGIRA